MSEQNSYLNIIVILEEADLLAENLLASIEATVDLPYEIIAINNGGKDEITKLLKNTAKTKEIRLEEHAKVATALNKALQNISPEAEYILFVTSDIILTFNAVSHLLHTLASDDKIGLLSGQTNSTIFNDEYTKMNLHYDDFISLNEVAKDLATSKTTSVVMRQEGFLSLIKRDVLAKVGFFDEDYEDEPVYPFVDLAQRLIKEHYLLKVDKGVYVHRERRQKADYRTIFYQNQAIFKQKWGYILQYSALIRRELLRYIDYSQKDLAILDVGCSAGGNFHFIHAQNPSYKLYGIELMENPAQMASVFAEVASFDIEEEEHITWQAKMDYIIMGDILEHLKNPWHTLQNMYKLLREKGKIIVSIPNVEHISVLYDLLRGDFPYQEAGILDRTHLRFFTQKTAIELIESANFEIEYITYSTIYHSQAEAELKKELLNLQTVTLNEDELEAYQWIIVASKKT